MDFLQGLNPQQQAAVAHVEGPLLLLAGAGSGKTTRDYPSHRSPGRVHHVPGPCILAVTFTNKAADEMRQRVISLLGVFWDAEASAGLHFPFFRVRLLRRDGYRLADIRRASRASSPSTTTTTR